MSYVGLFVLLFVDDDETPREVAKKALVALDGANSGRSRCGSRSTRAPASGSTAVSTRRTATSTTS